MRIPCPTPPLGWNRIDRFGGYLREQAAFAPLEAFALIS